MRRVWGFAKELARTGFTLRVLGTRKCGSANLSVDQTCLPYVPGTGADKRAEYGSSGFGIDSVFCCSVMGCFSRGFVNTGHLKDLGRDTRISRAARFRS